jgi:hypothetical protein
MTILRHREYDIEAADHTLDNSGLVNGQLPVRHDWDNDPFPDLEPRPSLSFRRTLEIEDIPHPILNSQPHLRTYYGPVAPPRPYTEEERQANPDRPPLEPPGEDMNEGPDSGDEQPKEPSIINQMDLVEENDPVWFSKHPRVRRFGEWIKEKLETCPRFGDFVWRIWRSLVTLVNRIKAFFERVYNGLVNMFLSGTFVYR